jgi:hypothetical protein
LESICRHLLAHCLEGSSWSDSLIDEVRSGLETAEGSRRFFSVVIERLGDLFEPRLCTVYARLMGALLRDPSIEPRYGRIREPRKLGGADPRRVYVLSRITLGADVAVTSVLLNAAKRRFPQAKIFLVGPRKNWELYAADPRISHYDAPYGRSATFAERIAARPLIEDPDGIVLDPDSRLSQLGILPVIADDSRYFFFESRAYNASSTDALPELASQWCVETLDVAGSPFVAPLPPALDIAPASVTVNLGVGDNVDKRMPDPFEKELLRSLPADTLIDLGGSPEEAERVRLAAGPEKRTFQGSFADFAWLISRSRKYVGYDSAGMHVAAACGVPTLCIFAGAVSQRFFDRWKPTGPGPIAVVRPQPTTEATLAQALTASEILEIGDVDVYVPNF